MIQQTRELKKHMSMTHIPTLTIRSLLLLLGLALCSLPAWSAVPRVVVTIKPIHSLVAGVMAGVGKPELLLNGAQSPHTVTLRPSDVKKIGGADLIVWVGKDFEIFLTHSLKSLSPQTHVLQLQDSPGIAQLPIREGGVWESRHEHTETSHDEPSGQPIDSHIWLSPQNAREIVTLVKQALIEIDPDNEQRYQDNARELKTRLNDLDQELLARLTPVQWVPFIVFHDAYQYFERHYQLNAIGSITLSPDRKPGARRIHEIHAKLEKLEARCIFSEPQFEPKLLKTIVAGTQVRTGVLDPIGADIPAGKDAYFVLMRRLSDSLVTCLEGNP
jgi:zinc transport system substrate-binding protein